MAEGGGWTLGPSCRRTPSAFKGRLLDASWLRLGEQPDAISLYGPMLEPDSKHGIR